MVMLRLRNRGRVPPNVQRLTGPEADRQREPRKTMALAAINGRDPAPPALWARAAHLLPDAPIVVMIHGYRFSPYSTPHCPHRHILSLTPDRDARRALSWPAALGFTADGPEGLAGAYGWEARGSLPDAYRNAAG